PAPDGANGAGGGARTRAAPHRGAPRRARRHHRRHHRGGAPAGGDRVALVDAGGERRGRLARRRARAPRHAHRAVVTPAPSTSRPKRAIGAREGAEKLVATGSGISGGRGRDDGAAGFALPYTPGAMNTRDVHLEGAHQRGASHGTGRGDYGGVPTPRVTAAAMSRALLAQALPDRYPLADDAARSLVGYRPYELARRALDSARVRTGGLAPVH